MSKPNPEVSSFKVLSAGLLPSRVPAMTPCETSLWPCLALSLVNHGVLWGPRLTLMEVVQMRAHMVKLQGLQSLTDLVGPREEGNYGLELG